MWTEPPTRTQSFALLMIDPDTEAGDWTHWVIYNIPLDVRLLEENQPKTGPLTNGGLQGTNSFGTTNYGSPCPPQGTTHLYDFFLYALDTSLPLAAGATKEEMLAAMDTHILATLIVAGSYRRGRDSGPDSTYVPPTKNQG